MSMTIKYYAPECVQDATCWSEPQLAGEVTLELDVIPCHPCCGEGYTLEAEHNGVGEMEEVTLGSDLCLEWSPNMSFSLEAEGGEDTDVCVNFENSAIYFAIPVDTEFDWDTDLPGYVDPENPRRYIATPPMPNYCDIYTVTVTAIDGGECNANDGERTDSITVAIYRCQRRTASAPWTAGVYWPCPDNGLMAINFSGNVTYDDCNGAVVAIEQWVVVTGVTTAGGGNVMHKTNFAVSHAFEVNGTLGGGVALTQGACGSGMAPPGSKAYCGSQPGAGVCGDLIRSRFQLNPVLTLPGGSCFYPVVGRWLPIPTNEPCCPCE